jgi:hypothetical protein
MFISKVNKLGNEEFYPLGYNAVYSVENQPTFRRNMHEAGSKQSSRLAGTLFFS